ncbi:MAG: acyl carrier protein [Clostridium sartagoforme]|nr:acyl carrier protein [Clostridium sartagoforme]
MKLIWRKFRMVEAVTIGVEERVLKSFERIGILIDDASLDIMEYIGDSLSFISSVMELEDEFQIRFPNDMLNYEVLGTVENLVNIIKTLLEENV